MLIQAKIPTIITVDDYHEFDFLERYFKGIHEDIRICEIDVYDFLPSNQYDIVPQKSPYYAVLYLGNKPTDEELCVLVTIEHFGLTPSL